MKSIKLAAAAALLLGSSALAQETTLSVEALLQDGYTITTIDNAEDGRALLRLRRDRMAAECLVNMETGEESCESLGEVAETEEDAELEDEASPMTAERLDEVRPIVVAFLQENGCSLERSEETAALAEAFFTANNVDYEESTQAAESLLADGVLDVVDGVIVLKEGCESE